MTDTHAQIASKGLDATGFTEELAAELFHKVGSHLMAIVDLQVVDRSGPNVKDKRKVHLIIDGIEPALNDEMAEHLRELSRVGYLNRAHANGTLAINEQLDGERTVADVMAAGRMHRPHPFLPVDASIENGICDVCGTVAATAVHSTQQVLDEPDPEGEETAGPLEEFGDEPETDDQDDEEPEDSWEYDQPEGTTKPLASVPDPFSA